ncbi:VWA domain-containing protein [Isosphaeraceae bacterium EP7]
MPAQRLKLGESPMTDLRSLSSSFVVHSLLMLLASWAAFQVIRPGQEQPAPEIQGELGPVDNRAGGSLGGGNPGELGALGIEETVAVVPEGGDSVDPADALLAEAMPAPMTASAPSPRALPGPATSGLGTLPGPGTGGGGGSGGGSGGGIGRGTGPGTTFFNVAERAGSFAYVIDCSGSMQSRGALDLAKRELMASLSQLPPDARFGVVFYNLRATVFTDSQGRASLMTATAANKERVRSLLSSVSPDGGTDHMLALRTGFDLRPEVIFFLSDGDLMTTRDAAELRAEAGKIRIQAVEFGLGEDLRHQGPLQDLAKSTGGVYRYVDVRKFPRPTR